MTDDTVFIGIEDGVAIYAKRDTIDGVDRAMRADHMRRAAQEKAARGLWEYNQRKRKEGRE